MQPICYRCKSPCVYLHRQIRRLWLLVVTPVFPRPFSAIMPVPNYHCSGPSVPTHSTYSTSAIISDNFPKLKNIQHPAYTAQPFPFIFKHSPPHTTTDTQIQLYIHTSPVIVSPQNRRAMTMAQILTFHGSHIAIVQLMTSQWKSVQWLLIFWYIDRGTIRFNRSVVASYTWIGCI